MAGEAAPPRGPGGRWTILATVVVLSVLLLVAVLGLVRELEARHREAVRDNLEVVADTTARAIELWFQTRDASLVDGPDGPVLAGDGDHDLATAMAPIVSGARFSDSGETYLLDAEGRLLTASRFEEDLASIGLLDPGTPSAQGLRITDPGRDLTVSPADGRPDDAPLTRMAASLVRGERASDVSGYRDYRGVEVMGAWTWIEDLGIGVATEIDVAEAMAPIRTSVRLVLVFLGGVVLLAGGILLAIRRGDRWAAERHAAVGDVAAMRQRVEERSRALEDALAVRNAFLGSVSHELRTPVTVISGVSETLLLRDGELSPEDRRSLVRRMAAHAVRLEELVTTILDVSELRRGARDLVRADVDLLHLLQRTVARSLPDAWPVDVTGTPVQARVDAAKIERVIEVALDNVVTHTTPGTPVRACVVAAPVDGAVLLTVEDDGPGIPTTLRDALLEPFRQGPQHGQPHAPGLGVGLALAHEYVALHGGELWLEESRSGGTCVRVRLPVGARA